MTMCPWSSLAIRAGAHLWHAATDPTAIERGRLDPHWYCSGVGAFANRQWRSSNHEVAGVCTQLSPTVLGRILHQPRGPPTQRLAGR
jgi:hypothetical protein